MPGSGSSSQHNSWMRRLSIFMAVQHVAEAAERADRDPAALELAAQAMDVDLDGAGVGIGLEIEHAFADLRLADRLAGLEQQVFEHRMLARRQGEIAAAEPEQPRLAVEFEIAAADHCHCGDLE